MRYLITHSYPTVEDVLHAHKRGTAQDYNTEMAARRRPHRATFIPSNNPKLNTIAHALQVPIMVDVPRISSSGTLEEYPYTDSGKGEIHLPHPDAFSSPDFYAHTLAHELAHFTIRHFQRPGWRGYTMWEQLTTDNYRNEELVAELTAMRLELLTLGRFATEESSLAYLRSWLEHSNEGALPEVRYDWATKQAEMAAEYLMRFAK